MSAKLSSKLFDEEFKKMEHYHKYEKMLPYVGGNYKDTEILIIGESFYLPNECQLNKSSIKWYNSTQDELTENEKEWIDCRGLVECDWKSNGHFIYRELNRTIESVFGLGFEKVAFMNGFQRPACKEGESFRYDCEDLDVEIAYKTINRVQEILKPEKVIFVSKYTWDKLNWKVIEQKIAKLYDWVCHPGTGGRYWNNSNYPSGKEKFIELLKK